MATEKNNLFIYQIFYDNETKKFLDEGFIPLDNSINERSDWREYWVIRNYLINTDLNEESLYGFFSWKFMSKTNLTSKKVIDFIKMNSHETDVFLFSPYFDHSAFFINVLEQAVVVNKIEKKLFSEVASIIDSQMNIDDLITDSRNTVFSNYFVAKPKFWRVWFDKAEEIFDIAEENKTNLAVKLNAFASHDTKAATKTFVIERIASLILARQSNFRVKAYNSIDMPISRWYFSKEYNALIQLDALKIAYSILGHPQYLQMFKKIQEKIKAS